MRKICGLRRRSTGVRSEWGEERMMKGMMLSDRHLLRQCKSQRMWGCYCIGQRIRRMRRMTLGRWGVRGEVVEGNWLLCAGWRVKPPK